MTSSVHEEHEILIVGAGFAGLYQLHKLRERGHDVHVVESASGLGGVWYWNCYPGARVDTWGPMYQFSDEKLWRDWNFSELYPNWEEVRKYFHHVDEKLGLSRDITFDTRVTQATFDEGTHRWNVVAVNNTTGEVRRITARYLVLCTGFGSKPYIPDLPGLDTFQGIKHHTARWPQEGIDLSGKRLGVIGTGASGVQVIQEAAPVVDHLTVFQRTPMIALPMRQRTISDAENAADKQTYPQRMARRNGTFAGFDYDFVQQSALEVSDEERTKILEELWEIGGFVYWLGNFSDVFSNEESNRYVYDFWRDKTRMRIKNKDLWDVLAPTDPPHPFGVKRPSLEQRYYEVFNQDNVDIVTLRSNPIERVTPAGVVTADGIEHRLDVLVLATGFDAVTGGITAIDIRNAAGESFADSFKDGAHTALGTATAGFPNLLFVYGPQSPSAFCNGPTCAEAQGEWVVDFLDYLRENRITRIEPTREAEKSWQNKIDEITSSTLFDRAESWYMGANVPGKKVQMLMYPGGLPMFLHEVNESAANGYPEFVKN
ncbi:NAD(P)/FAD-dependent oxidoreductase [Rhodococcus rhodochrous]|uniref:NAD(P)/FAD-dependent oxidoreductase n=1 Tax=Rhodococcus rhodochrous TaxID=1829 RepID=A0AAW4XN24_RHORH|nr:NAD(P)/FAD-dependent oxidoreductase [Rhodococcus rhodochrous]MCD2114590.1 NAD(P)/FAD-dependent oxidoreductase [Rhodococcus rhodochrous]